MMWTGQLPAPVLERNTATYREVFSGVDLVLEAANGPGRKSLTVRTRPKGAGKAATSRLGVDATAGTGSVDLHTSTTAVRWAGRGKASFPRYLCR